MSLKKQASRLLGLLLLAGTFAIFPARGADSKVLPGHLPPGLARLKSSGQLPATNQLRLAIGLPLRNPAEVADFLTQIYDPASPNYRHFLSPEEFTARFGPTEQDYEAVKQFARTNGLRIEATYPNRLVLDVAGPAAAVEKACHVTLQTYSHPTESRQFFAPDTEPTVAANLPIADIQGLSDFSRPHPRAKKSNATNSPKNGSGAGGAYLGDDFRNAYAPGTTLTGAGQQVGLLEFDGYYANDIAAYARAAGGGRTNITIQTVLLDGYNGVPTTGANSGNSEVALDIELAMAMAPGLSKIVVFEAGPSGFQNDVLSSMVENSAIKNLACCWGWDGGPSTTTDNLFIKMAAQGQSFFNASGDSGAFTVGASSVNGVDNPATANAPSSSPYITQVGGTTLTMNGTGASFGSETVWNWGGGSASSGGVSSFYAIPAWQTGISMTANLGSTSGRNIPDVAMTADNCYVVYDNGSTSAFGGTSCAAPMWAGFLALVNQQAASVGSPPPGLINAAVYAIGKGQNPSYSYKACFHDTQTGDNFWSSSPANYPAVTGYDLCTGWGSPNGVSLINALAGSTDTLGILPAAGFEFSGVTGGPFAPSVGTLQLTNLSAATLNWSLVNTSAWIRVDLTNGTLPAYSAASVGVSIAPAATNYKVGNYSTALTFTNRTSQRIQKIPLTLHVLQPMSVSPATGFTAVGPVGGPFVPSAQTFILTNLSANALKWGLVKTSAWLTVSITNGSLAAGAQTSVNIGLASTVKTLRAGVFQSNVRFTNSAGLIAVVPFKLSVGQPLLQNGGFETGDFSGWTQSGNTEYTTVTSGNAAFVHTGRRGAKLGPSGTPGYLSQTVPTVVGKSYLVSFWLRNAAGSIPNWFQVQWNGTSVFEQSDFVTAGWTNFQFVVTADSTASVLQLGFQDDPNYLGLDDVSLKAVTTPAIKSMIRAADDFRFSWSVTPGAVYQVQYQTNLLQSDWINLGNPQTANTDTLSVTDTNAFMLSPQRFYRLLTLP